MSIKAIVLIAVAVLSLPGAHAQNSASAFCENSYQKVCTDNREALQDRKDQIDRIKGEIADEAKPLAQAEIAKLPPLSGIGPRRWLGQLRRWLETEKIKNRFIIEVAGQRLGGLESEAINQDSVKTIKKYLKEAIENSKFDRYLKDNFKGIIEGVTVGNFMEYAERVGLKNGLLAQLFSAHCGIDGLIDNAFATESQGQDYVLICPGWQISLKLGQRESETKTFNTILQVLTHEMAHHIDPSRFGENYKGFISCIANNHGNALKADLMTKVHCNIKPAECAPRKAEKHSGEIAADTWAAEVVSAYLRDHALSLQEKEQGISEAFVRLCGSSDEGIHPDDRFRLEHILLNNPTVRTQLECRPAPMSRGKYCAY